MNKIKITELEFKNSKTYHNGIEVDLSEDYGNELLDLEDDKLEFIQLKFEEFNKLPTVDDMNYLLQVKMLSSLLRLKVIEDVTVVRECSDMYFFEMNNSIREMIGLEADYYNPYNMKYPSENLKKEDDDSYTLDGITCIESNNRTSNFFRDFLMLYNAEGNVLQLGFDDNKSTHKFPHHSFIKVNRNNDQEAFEYIDTLIDDDLGYPSAFIKLMVFILRDWNDCRTVDKVKRILSLPNMTFGKHSYNSPTMDLLELKAIKLKEPSLLFNNLMELNDEADIQYGLLRLGFNLIE